MLALVVSSDSTSPIPAHFRHRRLPDLIRSAVRRRSSPLKINHDNLRTCILDLDFAASYASAVALSDTAYPNGSPPSSPPRPPLPRSKASNSQPRIISNPSAQRIVRRVPPAKICGQAGTRPTTQRAHILSLSSANPSLIRFGKVKRAGVLVALFERPESPGLRVLLTTRSKLLR